MLMALARVVESGLRQVEGHEWVGFSVPTTIFSTLAGALYFAVLAPLFLKLWLTLIAKQSYGNCYAKTQAHFKVIKRLNLFVVSLALSSYSIQVQMWSKILRPSMLALDIDIDVDIRHPTADMEIDMDIDIDISCCFRLLHCLTFYSFFPNTLVSDPLLSRQLRGTVCADSVLLCGKRSFQLHLVFPRCDSQWEDRP